MDLKILIILAISVIAESQNTKSRIKIQHPKESQFMFEKVGIMAHSAATMHIRVGIELAPMLKELGVYGKQFS